MPHATECSTNLISSSASVSLSSPIQIPISGSTSYGRNSNSSSYSTSTVTTTLDDLSDYICNPADNMNVGFDHSYQTSSDEGSTYTSTITSDSVGRNLQPGYPRDYNCCGTDHQNLHDLLQHVDNSHPGLIVDFANGTTAFPFEPNTVYSQDRWDLMSTIQIPIPSVTTPLTTLTPNSLTHEQKNINLSPSTSAPLYSINVSSIPNNKQKGNGLGHPNSGIGQFDRYDQINDINGIMTSQNQDSLACDNWMLAYQLSLIYDKNPLRDPNFSSTLYGDQTLSSNPSSISTSLDDDNPLFDISSIDIPSKALQHQDPFSSPLLSITSYPPTPSSDDNSVVVSPVSKNINTKLQDNSSSSTLSLQNTSYGSISSNTSPISSNNDINSQQKSSMPSNQQNYINNSRQRPILSSSDDTNSHAQQSSINLSTTSHPLSSFDNVKNEQGSIDNKTLSIVQRCSPTSKLITNQSVSPTISNHRQSYGPLSGFLQTSIASNVDNSSTSQPRRSSTSTIHQSQSVVTTMSQNEQYRSLNMSNLGQGNISSSGRPIAHLRRSSTSNLTPSRTNAYGIPIDKSAYISSSQYSVDGYSMVGHVSSGEASSGAITPFSSKYHPIQPKAGVAMSDVYTDPALDIKGSKKRTVSTPSVDIKSVKKRVTKSSDESVSEASVTTVLPSDLSSEAENRGEADIFPYKCSIPGCIKTYKNANGLKYHNEHGHVSQNGNGAREKPWACHYGGCLKTYGSKGGLIYHVKRCHPNDLWALP